MATTRRTFLANAGALAAAITTPVAVRAAPNRAKVRTAVIGGGNQGKHHVNCFKRVSNAEVVAVCDIDSVRLEELAKLAGGVRAESDCRRVLDDPNIDAVTIATPDHWHTPAALLALQAGKHVYVEKPCSHNIAEGRLLVDAAAASGRVVAHGTQARSDPGMREAVAMLREGVIGDVLVAKCWNWQLRQNVGHKAPSSPPAGVDYDTWVGPAEWMPFQANRFHYDWHWWFNFGCGEMGNDGIHELDYALWGLGVSGHPTHISAGGGKYYFDDDQQFPDTQQVTLEWPGGVGDRRMLVYEQRLWSTTYPFNVDSGAEFYGTTGKMFLSKRGKIQILGERNRPIDRPLRNTPKSDVAANLQNWIDCIGNGDAPNAPIDAAHRTATVVHLGNIATRLGRSLKFDPQSEQIVEDDQANALIHRAYREGGHWSVPRNA